MADPLRTASRLLSRVLRHQPELAGVQLDAAGWVDVDALLAGLARLGHPLTRAQLDAVVAANDKQRFGLSPDGQRIRARQGHSVPVQLDYAPATPPPHLWHGTTTRHLPGIRAQGLVRGQRHHVHLSADPDTARRVGQRHGPPVVLEVDAARMHAAGHVFFRTDNGVWLTDAVPPGFLGGLD